jgi:hypothetical protein
MGAHSRLRRLLVEFDVEHRSTIAIEPGFDSTISTHSGLSLRYGTTTERVQLAAAAGTELGRELEITQLRRSLSARWTRSTIAACPLRASSSVA